MPQQHDKEGRRRKEEEVLAVASEYFLEHGYEGASINAMARNSGISKESIYRYFNSKKALFEAVIEREMKDYQERLLRLDIAPSGTGFTAELVAAAEAIISVVTSDRTLALRRLIFQEAIHSPDLGQHFFRVGPTRAYGKLEQIFASSSVRSAFGPAVLARYFVSLVAFQVMIERECRVLGPLSPEGVSALADTLVRDFLTAFVAAPGPAAGQGGGPPAPP